MLKMHRFRWTPWLIPLIFFLIVQLIAIMFAPSGYDVIRDHISWLGEQGLTYSWMINYGWMGFGILILLVVGWFKQKEDLPPSLLLPMMVFGIALMLMGLWNVDSSDEMLTEYHFYALYIAQGAVVLAALLHVFLVKIERLRLMNLIFALIMFISAFLPLLIPSIAGFTERLFWIVLVIWLTTVYGRMDFHHDQR